MTTNCRLGIRTPRAWAASCRVIPAATLLWAACGGAERTPEGDDESADRGGTVEALSDERAGPAGAVETSAAGGADPMVGIEALSDEEALQVFPRADSGRDSDVLGAEDGVQDSTARTAGSGGEGLSGRGSPGSLLVSAGTMVRVFLDEDVSAERHVAGHAVIATVAADVLAADGRLLVPAGAKLLGRVLVSEPSPGPGEDAHLELEFETLSTGTYERPVQAALAGGVLAGNPFGGFVEARPYQGRIRAGAMILVEMRRAFSVPSSADSLSSPSAGAGNAG